MTTDQRSGLSSKGPEKTETVLASSVELTQRGTLDLSGKLISLQNCVSVANALRNDSAIIELIINECNVGDKGCALLCESLMENMNVKTLSLKGNGIGQYGSLALAELIRANQTITHLFLDWNTIGLFPDGFNAIFRSLATNVGIVSLDLRNNSLGGIAGMSIAASLKLNQTLQTLDLRWNRLGVVGGQAISESIVHNFTITTLEVTGNEIPDDIINTVEVVVLRNREIQSLSNKKQDDSVDKEHEINKLREQIGQYLSLIEALKKENEGLKNSLDEHNNVLKKINDKLDRLEKENQKLKRDSNKINKLCAQKENDLIKAKQVYDEESKTLKNSLAELQRVEEQNKEKLLKLKQGIEENAKLRDEIKSLNALIKEKEKLLEGQNREIGELKSNYNSLKNSKDAEIAILLNENKQLKDRISLLLEQIKQSEEKATQIERKFDEKIKQLEIKLEECKEKAQKVQNEQMIEISSLKNENMIMKNELKQFQDLQKKFDELAQKKLETDKENGLLRSSIDIEMENARSIQEKLRKADQRIEELQNELRRAAFEENERISRIWGYVLSILGKTETAISSFVTKSLIECKEEIIRISSEEKYSVNSKEKKGLNQMLRSNHIKQEKKMNQEMKLNHEMKINQEMKKKQEKPETISKNVKKEESEVEPFSKKPKEVLSTNEKSNSPKRAPLQFFSNSDVMENVLVLSNSENSLSDFSVEETTENNSKNDDNKSSDFDF